MTRFRPPYGHAAGASAGAFVLYVLTLAPTTWFWDTSEYIATAHILGIPHPPGNPLFVVVGRVWTLLLAPTGLDVAVRVNLFAAFTSALATGFLFLVAFRILWGWLDDGSGAPAGEAADERADPTRRLALVGAWLGALLGATAFTVWNQSNVNEKVYTLSVLGIAVVSWLAIRWYDRRNLPGSGWLLVAAVYVMILGSTNHLMALLPAPALGLLVLVARPRVILDRNLVVRGVLAVVLALSFNFFLPLRAELQPRINEGEPVCESLGGAAAAIYTNGHGIGRDACPALAANLTRDQYAKPPLGERQAPLGHQLLNYFQYFDWQWARGLAASEVPGNARLPVSLLFLGLGLWGLVVTAQAGRGPGLFMGTLAFTLTLALVYYLNFRHGYSLAPPDAAREVRERDYFFIASFHLWGFLAGMGLVALWRWAAGGGAKGAAAGGPAIPTRNLLIASPILLVAFVPLVFNWAWASRSGDYSARDWAYDLLHSVEPYGVLFTNGDNDTFPLWYLQEVEGIRRDVTVVVVQYLYTDWYPRQLAYHTAPERQRPFGEEDDTGIFQVPASPPTQPITRLTDAELDQVPSGVIRQAQTFELGDVAIQYPAGTWLGRGDRIALAIIRDSLGQRPIYFASTGGLPQEIGLERWVVRQGLAARLHVGDPGELDGVVQTAPQIGGDWIDVETTRRLADEVFTYRGLEDRDIWSDRATLNIPWHFYYLFYQLADGADRLGSDEDTVREYVDRAERFMITARGGRRGTP